MIYLINNSIEMDLDEVIEKVALQPTYAEWEILSNRLAIESHKTSLIVEGTVSDMNALYATLIPDEGVEEVDECQCVCQWSTNADDENQSLNDGTEAAISNVGDDNETRYEEHRTSKRFTK